MKKIGERIKQARELQGVSRKNLGHMIGLESPDSRLSVYENNMKYPRMNIVHLLAKTLGVSVDWLLTGKLDKETMDTIERISKEKISSGIVIEPELIVPKYYEEFSSFLVKNEELLRDSFCENDWKNLYYSLINKLMTNENKQKISQFMELDQFQEWSK